MIESMRSRPPWPSSQSDLQNRPAQHGGQQGTNPPLDPWANWHQTHQNLPKKSGHLPRGPVGDSEDGSTLSEEEKRTLIVGGWAQDTKKATIEVESRELLARDEIKNLVDEQVLAVYGPRRSVGSLRFDYRQNESFQSLRDRMWKTIKAIRELAIKVPSARENPDSKPAWASFVKTKEARRRTMLVSQTRRVCIQLAGDTKSDEGGPCKPVAVNADSYDTDWGSGTIWQGQIQDCLSHPSTTHSEHGGDRHAWGLGQPESCHGRHRMHGNGGTMCLRKRALRESGSLFHSGRHGQCWRG